MDLLTGPPPAGAIAAMSAIEGMRFVPAVLGVQVGPEGHLGPESAGAILLLQSTFVDEEAFGAFWAQVASLSSLLASAPGFIRRHNFVDGPHYTLIAWWRTVEDANAFFARPEHQEAMRATFAGRWSYTHFAGLWQTVTPRRRVFYCQVCDAVTPSTEPECVGCGAELEDPCALETGSQVSSKASRRRRTTTRPATPIATR